MLALSTIKGGLVRNGRGYWRWTPLVRKLDANAAAVALKLKDLAPHAAIALVVPGGALMALLLWLYRRQKRRRVFPDSLGTTTAAKLWLLLAPHQLLHGGDPRSHQGESQGRNQSRVLVRRHALFGELLDCLRILG